MSCIQGVTSSLHWIQLLLSSTSTISEGDDDGCADGLVDGDRDGDRDGTIVGEELVGIPDGVRVGAADGWPECILDGLGVGDNVAGAAEGLPECILVGLEVGAAEVGLADGTLDFSIVGIFDGK